MIDGIVYYSKYGSTARYAKSAANMLSVPVYTIKEAKKQLKKGSRVLYFAPVRGAKLLKYFSIYHYFAIVEVCAVGILPKTILTCENIKNENMIYKPITYVRGAINFTQLSKRDKRYWKRFKRNIMNYDEVYYDTSMDCEVVLSSIFEATSLDFFDDKAILEIVSPFMVPEGIIS